MTSTRPPRATGGPVTKARAPTSREKDQKQPGIAARREKISSAGSLKGDLGDKRVLNTAQSTNSRRNSAPLAGAKPAAKSKLTKVDGVGTQKLIQKEWRSKKGGDLLSKLNRINSLLDNPLLSTDNIAAAQIIQRYTRGFLTRRRRQKGHLFPVEAQSHADAKMMMPHYGASVYALDPAQRRRRVVEHHAAARIQRAARKCIIKGGGSGIGSLGGDQPLGGFVGGAAALSIQRVVRGHIARAAFKKRLSRMSKASVAYSKFLSTDLSVRPEGGKGRQHDMAATQIQSAFRGGACRKRMRGEKARSMWAAVLIQSWFRGRAVRKFADRVRNRILLRRVVNVWNKVMWTLASPVEFLERHPSTPPLSKSIRRNAGRGDVVDEPEDGDEAGAHSTPSGAKAAVPQHDFANFLSTSPTKSTPKAISSPKGSSPATRTSFALASTPSPGIRKEPVETPRRSVVVDGETGAVVVQDLDDGEGITLDQDKGGEEEMAWAVEKAQKQVIERPPARHLDDVGPDGGRVYPSCFTGSMELEPGVLAWAMREDEAAGALQRALRRWIGRRRRAALSAAHTPPSSCRAKKTGETGMAGGQRKAVWDAGTGGGGGRGLSSAGSGGTGGRGLSSAGSAGGGRGMMSEEEGEAWRVEIEKQVTSIHIRLDSAKKDRAARSRTPPPVAEETDDGGDVAVSGGEGQKPERRQNVKRGGSSVKMAGLPMIPTPPRR